MYIVSYDNSKSLEIIIPGGVVPHYSIVVPPSWWACLCVLPPRASNALSSRCFASVPTHGPTPACRPLPRPLQALPLARLPWLERRLRALAQRRSPHGSGAPLRLRRWAPQPLMRPQSIRGVQMRQWQRQCVVKVGSTAGGVVAMQCGCPWATPGPHPGGHSACTCNALCMRASSKVVHGMCTTVPRQ